jgi:cytochrome o ubiquinol oxidase subunit 2
MKKIYKILIGSTLSIIAIAAISLYVSKLDVGVLEPSGFIGEKEKDLIITSSLLMLIVAIPVFFMTVFFAWHYREGAGKGKHTPDWEHNTLAECFWWGVPLAIIACLAVITYKSSKELSPFKPIQSSKKPLVIQAIALQWKWLFIYKEEGIATINYIKFPVDRPLLFEITADAPMNSFWIPKLGGQIYAMPAMRSQINLIANKTGVFDGLSANLSGTGFAAMKFKAFSESEEDFESWLSSSKNNSGFGKDDYEALRKADIFTDTATYRLNESGLFDQIIDRYMLPNK